MNVMEHITEVCFPKFIPGRLCLQPVSSDSQSITTSSILCDKLKHTGRGGHLSQFSSRQSFQGYFLLFNRYLTLIYTLKKPNDILSKTEPSHLNFPFYLNFLPPALYLTLGK